MDKIKGIFRKTHIDFSFILQSTGTINKQSYPWHRADLCLFTVYAVIENKKVVAFSFTCLSECPIGLQSVLLLLCMTYKT